MNYSKIPARSSRTVRAYAPLLQALLCACWLGGCVARETGNTAQSGSSTNFLGKCSSDESCGNGLSCVCGKCTQECTANDDCAALSESAACGKLELLGNACEDTPRARVCVAATPEPVTAPTPVTDAAMPVTDAAMPAPTPVMDAEAPGPTPATDAAMPEPTLVTTEPTSDSSAPKTQRCAAVVNAPSSLCEAQLCYPDALDVVALEPDGAMGFECSGYDGAEQCEGNPDYQAFEYRSDEVFAYLSFNPSIVGNYTPDAFASAFKYVFFEVYIPNASGLQYAFQTEPFDAGDPHITQLQFADGRLKLRVELEDLTAVWHRVESSEDSCFIDDISGECFCDYVVEPIPTTVELDLPIEGG